MRPPQSPVVNAEPDALTEYLSSLTHERQKEVKKYSNLPESDLEIPTEKRAAAILATFCKKYATVPKGQRNTSLFLYSCTLRRCGFNEDMILTNLWQFSREHCKPPHNPNNRDDVAELAQLSRRAARHVRPGFPREAVKEPAGQTPGKKAAALIKKADTISQRAQVPAADIIEDAEVILKTGTPLESLLNGFRLNHAGHEENARAIIYAFCAQSSATSKGIQPEVTGSKGSGKSHSIASTLFMMPEEYIWESSFSPKYLYYKPPQQGCIIYIDERLSEDLVNLVKKIMSNFQRETRHSTLVERGKPVELVIPKRIVIMGSTVNGAGDDQYNDRTVQVGIVNTPEDDEKYYEFESQRRAEGRPEFQVDDHILTCRAMLRHIREREFIVTIPRIRFAYLHDKRLINILFDFVEASAILNYMQREHEEKDKIVTVTPNKEDLNAALNFEMFRMNNAEAEGRLTRAETALHQTIQGVIKNTESEFTESEIAELYGKSQNAIRKLLYGDGGTQGHVTGGLVDKTPGWYTISPAVNPDLRGQNVIRAKKVHTSIGGSYAAFTE